jgi:hypothetical protein
MHPLLKELSKMLNRTGAVIASATLVTVGALAFLSVVPGSKFSLGSENTGHGQSASSLFTSDRSNLKIPTLSNLSEPNVWGRWCIGNFCGRR